MIPVSAGERPDADVRAGPHAKQDSAARRCGRSAANQDSGASRDEQPGKTENTMAQGYSFALAVVGGVIARFFAGANPERNRRYLN